MLNWLSALLATLAGGAAFIPDVPIAGVHVPVGSMIAAAVAAVAHTMTPPNAEIVPPRGYVK